MSKKYVIVQSGRYGSAAHPHMPERIEVTGGDDESAEFILESMDDLYPVLEGLYDFEPPFQPDGWDGK